MARLHSYWAFRTGALQTAIHTPHHAKSAARLRQLLGAVLLTLPTFAAPDPAPCIALDGNTLTLSNDTVGGTTLFEVCDKITVGPSYHVQAPNGDLTLIAGNAIGMTGGFSVDPGAIMQVKMDPTLVTGLIAAFNFDEGAGTIAKDLSGHDHNGSIVGAAWATDPTGTALSFDGSGDRIDLGAFDVPGSAFTASAWVRKDSCTGGDCRILSKAVSSAEQDHYFMVSLINGNQLRFRLKTDGVTTTLIGGTIADATWTYVTAVYDGATMRLYANGSEVASTVKTGTLSTNPAVPVWVGANPSDAYGTWSGLIDDVRIYYRALSPAEIQADMTTPVGATTPPTYACSDGIDNDADGLTDYPDDPGCAGSADDDETDVLPPGPTASLSASPSSITEGNSSTLAWSSTDATTCLGAGFSTGGATSGSAPVSPTTTTTYGVDCDGATDTVTVTVSPAPVYACSDGIDNDLDGLTDYPDDPGCVSATDPSETDTPPPSGGLRAFPGAEGFGTETPGGRGGKVYTVTTLNWTGPGSLSEALLATEPRIIVFRVSGVINVPQGVSLTEEHSYVTVAGQTSPGGITLAGSPGFFIGSYNANFHDAVFRFIRFRGQGNYDNIQFSGSHHLVFDHVDFSGATDETFDITHGHDITVQWSTITNSDSSGQNYGSLIAYSPTADFSLHHNLYAHHGGRCAPHLHWTDGVPPEGGVIEFSNNVIYNCAFDGVMYNNNPSEGGERLAFNMVGNHIKAGPNTPANPYVHNITSPVNLYAADNEHPGYLFSATWSDPVMLPSRAPAPALTWQSGSVAYDLVLDKAGAFPRDPMNVRTVNEVRNGTGSLGVIDDALLTDAPTPPTDSDLDGMPDSWESARGLNPADASDAANDRNGDGYTNIEEYINELADSLVPASVCVDGVCTYTTIQAAFDAAQSGSQITISGEWNQGGSLATSNVTIAGAGDAHLRGGAVAGKGIMVIQGNNVVVRDLECSEATVPDENGACIRFEGNGLTLDNVHFHDNENGLLSDGGDILIENSIFERNGYLGYAHGIYAGTGGELIIRNSQFLSSKSDGHEVKSRAARTVIEGSIIASLAGVDSRLIDIPNGGDIIIRNNVLEQGPNSSNSDAIGIGLEGVTHATNSILIDNNYVILERSGTNVLLQTGGMPTATVSNNTVIGGSDPGGSNTWYATRSDAGIAPYPYLPPVPGSTPAGGS